MAHTPTPWHARKPERIQGTPNEQTYVAAKDTTVAAMLSGASEEDAALIVRAVNAHAGLVEAMNRLILAAQRRDYTMGDPCTLIAVKAELAAAAKHANAILKAATGSAA